MRKRVVITHIRVLPTKGSGEKVYLFLALIICFLESRTKKPHFLNRVRMFIFLLCNFSRCVQQYGDLKDSSRDFMLLAVSGRIG